MLLFSSKSSNGFWTYFNNHLNSHWVNKVLTFIKHNCDHINHKIHYAFCGQTLNHCRKKIYNQVHLNFTSTPGFSQQKSWEVTRSYVLLAVISQVALHYLNQYVIPISFLFVLKFKIILEANILLRHCEVNWHRQLIKMWITSLSIRSLVSRSSSSSQLTGGWGTRKIISFNLSVST